MDKTKKMGRFSVHDTPKNLNEEELMKYYKDYTSGVRHSAPVKKSRFTVTKRPSNMKPGDEDKFSFREFMKLNPPIDTALDIIETPLKRTSTPKKSRFSVHTIPRGLSEGQEKKYYKDYTSGVRHSTPVKKSRFTVSKRPSNMKPGDEEKYSFQEFAELYPTTDTNINIVEDMIIPKSPKRSSTPKKSRFTVSKRPSNMKPGDVEKYSFQEFAELYPTTDTNINIVEDMIIPKSPKRSSTPKKSRFTVTKIPSNMKPGDVEKYSFQEFMKLNPLVESTPAKRASTPKKSRFSVHAIPRGLSEGQEKKYYKDYTSGVRHSTPVKKNRFTVTKRPSNMKPGDEEKYSFQEFMKLNPAIDTVIDIIEETVIPKSPKRSSTPKKSRFKVTNVKL